MKVSLNLAQFFSNVDLLSIPAEEMVRRVGAQLGAVEDVVHWGPRYEDVVVVRVVSCQKHPNADKLNVCLIDDGGVVKDVNRNTEGYVQVVCGAPNVREGLTVAWLPPGSTVPSTVDKDPFVLEARELRGEMSNGMLASAHELGISDDHAGILEIDVKDVGEELTKPGTPFKKLYGLDDVVIDCENKMFTHRPDCFGNLGVARELAGISGLKFVSPEWYRTEPSFAAARDMTVEVAIEAKELVPRFMAVVIKDAVVAPSPVWLQAGLQRVGIRPINNVVDITNFVMHLTGQPMHAYDYEKLKRLSDGVPKLIARTAKKGEQVELLGGKNISLDVSDIVIATDKQVIGVGGVMGGADTEVDETTKSIVLECATFDMFTIRKTSMRHGLFTDAVTRFNKGQSPLQNDKVLSFALQQFADLTGGTTASDVVDVHGTLQKPSPVTVSAEFVNERLGSSMSVQDMAVLLTNVEFEVQVKDEKLVVQPPFWRTDIAIAEDIVEEIGRLHGFADLPIVLPLRTIKPAPINPRWALKADIRTILARAGANEVLTYSFVHANLLKKAEQNADDAYQLSNALSPDLQYYRLSLVPSILDKVYANVRSGHESFALFEINKSHNKLYSSDGDEHVPKEFETLALLCTSGNKALNDTGAAFYQARAYVEYLAQQFGLQLDYVAIDKPLTFPVARPFDMKRSALVKDTKTGTTLGIVGEFTADVQAAFKLPHRTAGFELGLEELQKVRASRAYIPLSRFPSITNDVTLRSPSTMSYRDIAKLFASTLKPLAAQHAIELDIQPSGRFAPDPGVIHTTFRVVSTHHERTLTLQEINTILESTAKTLATHNITRV